MRRNSEGRTIAVAACTVFDVDAIEPSQTDA
jgi:hypothetical protein